MQPTLLVGTCAGALLERGGGGSHLTPVNFPPAGLPPSLQSVASKVSESVDLSTYVDSSTSLVTDVWSRQFVERSFSVGYRFGIVF